MMISGRIRQGWSRGRVALLALLSGFSARAESPEASYIFPAGGQRGEVVEARVGGFYFHGGAKLHMSGDHIVAAPEISETDTLWFEGPMIFQPDSQQKEDYPKDHIARIAIDPAALPGVREWYCQTDQGTSSNLMFVIGDLPEIVEEEIEGEPIPRAVELPVTINGRIFPREDIDVWAFPAAAGEPIVCEVMARGLGYPLDATLVVRGPDGRAVDARTEIRQGDPQLAFTAPLTGRYEIRIADANFQGLQNFVYRLMIRRGHLVIGHFPLGGEAGRRMDVSLSMSDGTLRVVPVSLPGTSTTVPVSVDGSTVLLPFHVPPAAAGAQVMDGRIDRPGKIETWPVDLAEGEVVAAEIFAHDFGSLLDSLITISDPDGLEVGRNDDRSALTPDSAVLFTAKKSGRHVIGVGDRFSGRGGPGFAYRLGLSRSSPGAIDFHLNVPASPLNIQRIGAAEAASETPPPGAALAVELVPSGPLKSDVALSVEGLPPGVELDGTTLPQGGGKTNLIFRTRPDTPLATAEVTIVGTADLGDGKTLTRRAKHPIRLSVVPQVPFRHVGQYWITNDHPSGSVLVKNYRVVRLDGFQGPLLAMLADRQIRHLQGVTGPVLTIPAGAEDFAYPVTFPPAMELGRTSRVQLMLVGEVDGKTVSYTTGEQNEQMITVTTTGLLKILTLTPTVAVAPGQSVEIPISIRRDRSLADQTVRLSADIPAHFHGVSADPVDAGGAETEARFKISFGPDAMGPFNSPLRIRAETVDAEGSPHTAETAVELVAPGRRAR